MSTSILFSIHISYGAKFIADQEKLQNYLNIHERSTDNCLQYVTALIHNEKGEILVGYNKKHGSRQIPSGKLDKGEQHDVAITREIQEETGLEVKKTTYVGTSKVILMGMVWQGHFYNTEVNGTLDAKETHIIENFKRVHFVKIDSRLGFGISDGKETVSDPQEILEKRHMFAEVFWITNFPLYSSLMKNSIIVPENLNQDEKYIQLWNGEKNIFEVKNFKDFLQ